MFARLNAKEPAAYFFSFFSSFFLLFFLFFVNLHDSCWILGVLSARWLQAVFAAGLPILLHLLGAVEGVACLFATKCWGTIAPGY